MLIISTLNIIFNTAPTHYVIIAVIWCTAMQFLLDGAIAIIINKMPAGWFGVDNPLYHVTVRERNFYTRLRVRRWKDKVWELGGLGGFSKRELLSTSDPIYLEKFIIECNKGVLTHRLSYPVGFFVMLMMSGAPVLTIALPIAVVNLFLNILPTIVLRHNTPMLKLLLKRINNRIRVHHI